MTEKFIHLRIWLIFCFAGITTIVSGQVFNVVPGSYYYDNSVTKWSAPYFMCGNASSVRQYGMTRVGSSDIWVYERTESSNTWTGATAAYFISAALPTVPSNITDAASAAGAKSAALTKSTVGQLYKADGTFQLMDIFFKHVWSGTSATYVKAVKISDTEWEYTGNYGSGDFFVSTNDANLGSPSTGTGVYEVNLEPVIMGGPYFPNDIVTVTFKTASLNPVQPLGTDYLSINGTDDGSLRVAFSGLPPAGQKIYTDTPYLFTGLCSKEADLTILLNDVPQATATGTTISKEITFTNTGTNLVKISATLDGETVSDSITFDVLQQPVSYPRPEGLVRGANYIDDNTVTLLFYAPGKESVYVVSELSNWQKKAEYQMNRDGDYFWITLTGLTKQKEYPYYYSIDDEIDGIADPYTRKALERWDAQMVSPNAYPNLTPYPPVNTNSVRQISVFQTAQPVDYVWECNDFVAPPMRQLSIYELLPRDFTNDVEGGKNYFGNLQGVFEKLDYLKDLGVNAIEIMPIIDQDNSPLQDGSIDWGYHSTLFFAPNKTYGTSADYKRFVDECHKRGIAVILDIELDHAYGVCPLVRMYADPVGNYNAQPAANNPWFNTVSPNPNYVYGADFNHESPDTKEFMEDVVQYWLKEYRFDGYRFDFSKGLTQTPGEGTPYDARRIAIIENYADKIWEVNPNAYLILEHFCANTEEKELASYRNGIMLWGKQYTPYMNATIGTQSGSGFSSGTSAQLGWSVNNRLIYMESHDEERVAYAASQNGVGKNDLAYRMKRCGLSAAFLFCMPGPRMMWQFGEIGYDYSIQYGGNSVYSKPPRWDYFDVPERQALLNIYRTILNFRKQYGNVIETGSYTGDVDGWPIRKVTINHADLNFILIGNFGETQSLQTTPAGTWYDLFTGEQQTGLYYIQPGEFKLLTSKKVDLTASINQPHDNLKWTVYPNPVANKIYIDGIRIKQIELFASDGRIIGKQQLDDDYVDVSSLQKGIYILKLTDRDGVAYTSRFIKQ